MEEGSRHGEGVQKEGPTGISGGESAEQEEAVGSGKGPEHGGFRVPPQFGFYSIALADDCTLLECF